MNKKEVSEIKKQLTPNNCMISRICGCYVSAEKEIITTFREAFLSLPEEEMFKYFEIMRKVLSGKFDKNLYNLEFPLSCESEGGTQNFLMKLRESELKNEDLLQEFYRNVIDSYDYAGNYLIILTHSCYDIPGKTGNGERMEDASDEVFRYVSCAICPMNLAKPGLAYNEKEGKIQNRNRDWVVEMPANGFIFPAFNDRTTDIHSLLYYSKKSSELQNHMIEKLFGCNSLLAAEDQKKMFEIIMESAFEEELDFETAKSVHDVIMGKLAETTMQVDGCTFTKTSLREVFEESGASEKVLKRYDDVYDKIAEEKTELAAQNIVNESKVEVEMGPVVISTKPEESYRILTKIVDGQKCIVIPIEDGVAWNGILTQN